MGLGGRTATVWRGAGGRTGGGLAVVGGEFHVLLDSGGAVGKVNRQMESSGWRSVAGRTGA